MYLADTLMERADNTALEDRPETFKVYSCADDPNAPQPLQYHPFPKGACSLRGRSFSPSRELIEDALPRRMRVAEQHSHIPMASDQGHLWCS